MGESLHPLAGMVALIAFFVWTLLSRRNLRKKAARARERHDATGRLQGVATAMAQGQIIDIETEIFGDEDEGQIRNKYLVYEFTVEVQGRQVLCRGKQPVELIPTKPNYGLLVGRYFPVRYAVDDPDTSELAGDQSW